MPKEGDQVIATGELSLYAPRGNYQLVIRELQFFGVGELLLKLHQLKESLAARGWFDSVHKKPLPKLPKRIGVVTSPTGAVIADILNVLTRRFKGFQVILNPVKVQGEGAAEEIATAIADFNRYELADVLIVGRGGGSIEDLWAFNEECVAKAIFESKIPVISAVGHETDFTIADWVADIRAPSPSAAAEIVIAEKAGLLKFLTQVQALVEQRIVQQTIAARQKLHMVLRHPLIENPQKMLQQHAQQIDSIREDLDFCIRTQLKQKEAMLSSFAKQLALLNPSQQIVQWKQQLAPYQERLHKNILDQIRQRRDKLARVEHHLRSIHPKNLMRKGYSILFCNQEIVSSVATINEKQTVYAHLTDGIIRATVEQVEHDTRNALF